MRNNFKIKQSRISQETLKNKGNISKQDEVVIPYQPQRIFKRWSCNKRFNTIKSNNEVSTFLVDMLLEVKEVLKSKD